MKTLREHLLERSRETAPERELAAMRERIAAGLKGGVADGSLRDGAMRSSPSALELMRTVWRELVLPCRGVWATVAAAWVAVLVLNHSERAAESDTLTQSEMVVLQALWREQRNLWAAAKAPSPAPSATPPEKEFGPGARPLGWSPGRTGGACVVTWA